MIVAGSLNLDLVGRAPRIPAPGETVLGTELQRHHGGKGGNQAVAAARMGGRVVFFGAVGQDAAGDEMLQGLRQEGIDVAGVCRVDGATGTALITVSEAGENAITVLPGANRQAPLPPAEWPLGQALLLLQLELPLPTTLAWAASARSAGARVLLNAAPAQALPPALLRCVDTLVVNEGELHALASAGPDSLDAEDPKLGGPVWEDVSPAWRRSLQAVMEMGPRRVVVTLGEAGCIAWNADADPALCRLPAPPVEVVDTTGAGDTFAGALAAGLEAGLAWELALARAVAAGSRACTVAGARSGMPHREDLEAWLGHAVAD